MRPQTMSRWWYIAGIALLWLLVACAQVPANPTSTPTIVPGGNSPKGAIYTAFTAEYQRCGGMQGAGDILTGPMWMGTRWVMVTTNMVFTWGVNDPQPGVHPMALNPPTDGEDPMPTDDNYVHYAGRNVPRPFFDFIQEIGGWECSGPPVSSFGPRPDQNNVGCQAFANLTLCYDYQTQSKFLEPLGTAFLDAHRNEMSPTLPTAFRAAPDWQMFASISPVNNDTAHLIASGAVGSAPLPSEATLVIQVRDVSTGATYYVDVVPVKNLAESTWSYDLPLGNLAVGEHRFVLSACVVADNVFKACAEDVMQLNSR